MSALPLSNSYTATAKRLVAATFISSVVTVLSFSAMHSLIVNQEHGPIHIKQSSSLAFVAPITPENNQQDDSSTHSLSKPEATTPLSLPTPLPLPSVASSPIKINSALFSSEFSFAAISINMADSEVLPTQQVLPLYPPRASARGIEGFVKVEYTISSTGSVKNARIVDSHPPNVFDKVALDAIVKFKFQPRVIGGQAVSVIGTHKTFNFELED